MGLPRTTLAAMTQRGLPCACATLMWWAVAGQGSPSSAAPQGASPSRSGPVARRDNVSATGVRRVAAEELPAPDATLGPAISTADSPASAAFPSSPAAAEQFLSSGDPEAFGVSNESVPTASEGLGEADGGVPLETMEWAPFDGLRHLGFRHSSTSGRHVGKGLPLERSSWLNRPLHVDWFAGPLITDSPAPGRVGQSNEILAGLRLGWDFDYFWGVEWRSGWSDPDLTTPDNSELSGHYFVSDINLIYYPWGDSRVRPYALVGLGLAEVGSVREDGTGQEEILVGMPLGGGVRFAQTRYLAWRLEILDNIAWGDNGLATMHNFSFTLGMELRLGARPNSYWPWRSARTVW